MKHAIPLVCILVALTACLAAAEATDTLPLGPSTLRLQLDKVESGVLYAAASGHSVDMARLVEACAAVDVVVIGEYHDSMECHLWQRDFIAALQARYGKVVVGFEFFLRGDAEALEQWRRGAVNEEELLRRTGWYQRGAVNYGYTRPIMELVRQHAMPVCGLNVPREIVNKVAGKGVTALSAEERALFPGVGESDPEHEYYIKTIFGSFAVQMPPWFANTYQAQKCWDIVMARSIQAMLARPEHKGYKGVIIAGAAHVAYRLGIPWRYARADRRARLLTVVPVQVPARTAASADSHPMFKALAGGMKPAAVFSRGIADYVLGVPETVRPFFPVLGLGGKMNPAGGYDINSIDKDSLAEKNGLRVGDVLLAVDGVRFQSVEEMRRLLAQKKWGDPLLLEVRKKVTCEAATAGDTEKK